MVELSQEEKDKLWADLKVQWQIVKGKGEGAEKAKKRINMIQKVLDLEITDFEAEEQFTEPQMDLMEKAVKKSIALKHILTGMIIKHDPKLKGNAPGIGQHVNITYDLIKEELKELMKNDKK